MALSDAELQEKIEEGSVHCIITFEVAGKPKEHVDETLDKLIKTLDEDKNVEIQDKHREETIELEDSNGIFSAYVEVEMVVPGLATLNYLMVNWTPASIEILEPAEFVMAAEKMQGYLNDTLSKLHLVAANNREQTQKAMHLNKSVRTLLHNFTNILLANGAKTDEQLAKMTGVSPEVINRVTKELEETEQIHKEGEKWTLASAKK